MKIMEKSFYTYTKEYINISLRVEILYIQF